MERKTRTESRGVREGDMRKLPVLFTVLALAAAAFVFAGNGRALAQEAPTQAQDPGAADVMGASASMLFRDDELLVGYLEQGDQAQVELRLNAPSTDELNAWSRPLALTGTAGSVYGKARAAAGVGRIADPERDQIVLAYWDDADSLHVELVGGLNEQGEKSYSPLRRIRLDGSPTDHDVAVAVGDLDLEPDADGYYHDEVVVAASMNGNEFRVYVLDYALEVLASSSFSHGSPDVAVTLGDFDGDLRWEIAVAAVSSVETDGNGLKHGKFGVSVGELLYDSQGGYSLHFPSSVGDMDWSGYPIYRQWCPLGDDKDIYKYNQGATLDIVSGDFANKGSAQIVVSGSQGLYVLATDAHLNLALKSRLGEGVNTLTRLASGLFYFDPGKGYDLDRRQIAVVELAAQCSVTCPPPSTWCFFQTIRILDMTDGYGLVTKGSFEPGLGESWLYDISSLDLSVAAGNFTGHGQDGEATSPEMQILVMGTYIGSLGYNSIPSLYKVSSEMRSVNRMILALEGDLYGPPRSCFLLAADADGDSWRLGADPVHMIADSYHDVKMVVQEPPKHVDYAPVELLPDGTCCDPEGEWEVLNISGFDEFHVQMGLSSEQSLKTGREKKTSWAVGSTASLEVDYTHRFRGTRSKIEGGIGVKMGYGYESRESDLESAYSGTEVELTTETARDDAVVASTQRMDVWIYPIVGYETGDADNPYGYYQIVIPGADANEGWLPGGGMDNADWYQPLHENRNLLSYPYLYSGGEPWTPPDLGSFVVYPDDPARRRTVSEIMAGKIFTYSSNPVEMKLEFTEKAGRETKKEYSNKIAGGLDVSAGIHIRIPRNKLNIDAGLSVDGDYSWEDSEFGEQESSGTAGLTLNVPEGSREAYDKAYAFMPVVYVTSAGAFKVAHAVDPEGSSNGIQWWRSQYNRKPDPALNLPKRFQWHPPNPQSHELEEYWTLVKSNERNKMRGFLTRQGEANPDTGEHEYTYMAPVDGETVLLCARVYNYSLEQPTGPFDVKFYYFPCDKNTGNRSGDLVSREGMTARVDDLGGMLSGENMTEVCVPWDTAGLSAAEGGTGGYRFEVHLDERNEVDEIHEGWGEHPSEGVPYRDEATGGIAAQMDGGNNVGVFPWSNPVVVLPPPATPATASLSSDARTIVFRRLSLSEDALSIEVDGAFHSQGPVSVPYGESRPLRARIDTAGFHAPYFPVVFYDGDPRDPKNAVASEMVRGLPEGYGYVRTNWTPERIGHHRLWVHMRGDSESTAEQNVWDFLDVNVTSDSPPVVVDSDETEVTVSFGKDRYVDATLKSERGARVWVLLEAPADFPGYVFARPSDDFVALEGKGCVFPFDPAAEEAAELYYTEQSMGNKIVFGPQDFTGFREVVLSTWKGASPTELELVQRVRLLRNPD